MPPPPPPCGGDPLEAPPGAGVQQTEPQECLKRSAQNHTSPDPSALSASTEEERRGGGGGEGGAEDAQLPLTIYSVQFRRSANAFKPKATAYSKCI